MRVIERLILTLLRGTDVGKIIYKKMFFTFQVDAA